MMTANHHLPFNIKWTGVNATIMLKRDLLLLSKE